MRERWPLPCPLVRLVNFVWALIRLATSLINFAYQPRSWVGALTLYPGIRLGRRPLAPRVCELPSRPQRFPHPLRRRPRTHFLPRSIRRHSPNPHLRRSTILANLPLAPPTVP